MTLRELDCGQQGKVQRIEIQGDLANRLEELGMTEGCVIRCLFNAPCKDPRAYSVRGTVLALRNADASRINITV